MGVLVLLDFKCKEVSEFGKLNIENYSIHELSCGIYVSSPVFTSYLNFAEFKFFMTTFENVFNLQNELWYLVNLI